jgi:hypothetical protein
MRSQLSNIQLRTVLLGLLTMVLSCSSAVWAQEQVKHSPAKTAAPEKPKTFATPQLAADALIKAAESYDVPALLEIFGPAGKDLVETADPVSDKNRAEEFAEKAHEKNSVSVEKTKAILLVGKDEWPLPVPIVLKQGQWHFDTPAGRQEILFRRIGENELDAIQIAHGYVEAQKEYVTTVHGDSNLHEYARKIISTPGKQDGLFWKNPDGSTGGPISEAIAHAIEQGYTDKSAPYHGYYFKTLKGQGPNAPLGKLDYEINGAMIGGFALVAVPAEYRVTGVKTFLVNQNGIVYEKDLGPGSLKIAKAMDTFNPDKSWQATKDTLVAQRP